jgi:hypothetical protein
MSRKTTQPKTAEQTAAELAGQRQHVLRLIAELNENPPPTVEMHLPLLFQLNGTPYTLHDHFPFSPMFRTRVPYARILKTARQVAKSTYLASSGLVLAALHSHFNQLYITPLFEQIRRFSANYMQPFIEESSIRSLLIDSSCNMSVLQRTFLNKSIMHFSYAYLSSSRIRGLSRIFRICIDECQDMSSEHLPIIGETMAATPEPWGVWDYTGTPKGFDNPIQSHWEESSQAEWVVKCRTAACNHWNVCTTQADLLKMIGPAHDDIGPAAKGGVPGTVCSKCRKPIDPRNGHWYHFEADRRWDFQGFHIPQPIMPMHYASKRKWSVLVAKSEGGYSFTPNMFHNEVLGESFDTGSKLLTLSELKAACNLGFTNNPKDINPQAFQNRDGYRLTCLACDWGGGGGDGLPSNSEAAKRRRISFTTIAFLGIRHDGKIDVLWGTRLLTPNDHALEASQVLRFVKALKPNVIAHDATGAGALRQTLLMEAGVPAKLFAGFDYKHIPTGKIIAFIGGDGAGGQPCYRVDKTRTLLTTIHGIKFGVVRFFDYDHKDKENPGLLRDFLALTEEKVETMTADRYVIRRIPSMSDDFAHSVNVGCCALWHATQSWPDFVNQARTSPNYLSDQVDWDLD